MAIDYGTIIDGASRSDNINTSGLPIDMEPQTKLLDPNSYVFEALQRQFGAAIACDQMKREYRERRLIPNYSSISAVSAKGATTVNITDYTRIKADYLVYHPDSGDLLLVQTKPTSTAVGVVNATAGAGGTSKAYAVGDKVVILGEAHAEGEEVPDAFVNDSINKFDYIMQKDRRVQVTDIEEAVKHYDSSEKRALDRKLAWIEYKRDQALLGYVGKATREIVTASGPRRHVMGGLFEKLTENVFDLEGAGSGFTLELLANIMGQTKFHGASSERKIGLIGTNGWMAISSWPRDALQVSVMEKKWGIRVNTIITGYGDMDVVYDPVLNADKGLQDRAVILDPAHIRQLYLRGLQVRMFLAIPNLSGIHQTVDAISGTFGLQVAFDELHAQISGIA